MISQEIIVSSEKLGAVQLATIFRNFRKPATFLSFAKKKPSAAFSILQEAIGRAPNLRSRFRTSLTASHICLQAQQDAWAKTLLEELFRQAESFTFEVWQPEAAVELHQLLAICYGRLAKNRKTPDRQAMRERFDTHVERLFQLDMQAAAAVHEQV